jgi:hypothetical protein
MNLQICKKTAFAAAMALAFGLSLTPSFAADKAQTITGQVSDAMCGAKHQGDPAQCTRGCVKKGSKYALVSGSTVYTLETSDQKAMDELDKLAGANASVKGTVSGDTITVASVSPAK